MDEKLLKAVSYAAVKHEGQKRKDGKTPYAAHPFRVCLTLRHAFGVEDEDVLTAAVLHDVIEDTTADFDEVEELFGTKVAGWVALLSKDMRLPKAKREPDYEAQIAGAPVEVQLVKLADLHDNIVDSRFYRAKSFEKVLERAKSTIGGLKASDPRLSRAIEVLQALIRNSAPPPTAESLRGR